MPDPTEAEIRERWAKISSPPPWESSRNWVYGYANHQIASCLHSDDARAIARAPTDIAWLLAELERVRELLERVRELADFARLLGPARMVLDRCAENLPGCADEAERMAQRIVDLIGHRVTDEPPHALVELDSLRAEVERLRAERVRLRSELRKWRPDA